MLRNATKSAVRKGITDPNHFPKPGAKLHGFTLLRSKHVPELELTALHLQHDRTGADYLHVARDDKNNVFSIGFKTNPPDDTGVPHILEHTTLCGSEKYPIRDPFFKMLPRTLSNFMNAFTASDHTFYPFATTNKQDFRNLMSVYMDATLHPLLQENDFSQEGWRIGPENPQAVRGGASEADSKLVFKGVVYNEMKGQMSDAGYLYYIRFQDEIFPSINNSGGDPQKITDLTYDQLKKFHADHYHPSNAKIMTYGDMPLADHLEEVNTRLDAFQRIETDLEIKTPIDLSGGPRFVSVPGPMDPLVDPDMQYKTSTTWLLGDTSDVLENFSLGVVSHLLIEGYGSPLYKGLIEAGLGPDWSPNTGFDGSGKIGMFSVGLTGVKKDDVSKVKMAIQDTLRSVKKAGFDTSKIDGYLHQLELSLKHKTASFGMGLLQRLKPKWFVGVDPFDSLAWNETVTSFKAKLAEGNYLESLLEKYLLHDNTLTFTMTPDATFGEQLTTEESERLATKIAAVTAEAGGEAQAREKLEKRELELLEEQGKSVTQDLSCLPSVHVEDIPREKDRTEFRDTKLADVAVQWREAPTNGLTYFRAVNILDNLPEELRALLPLFNDAIMRLGTKDKTMEELEDMIKLKTGGLSTSYYSSTSPTDFNSVREGLAFSGWALDRNVPDVYRLLQTLIRETDFDNEKAELRIRQLLQGSAEGAVDNIASSGHSYAMKYAHAGLTPNGRLSEQVGGLTQVKTIASLASRPESQGLSDIIAKLKEIQKFAIAKSENLRTAITCGKESVASNEAALQSFLSSIPKADVSETKIPQPNFTRTTKTFFPLPYQVYYSALALPTVPYTSPSSAPLQLLAQLLTHKHLHHEIREKGGAYGGGAYAQAAEGIFGFYSYRDPNPLNTMRIYSGAGQFAAEKEWTDRDIEEAKISVFQRIDAPKSVSQEGMDRFLSGLTEEMIKERRARLLDLGRQEVRDVAQKYIVEGMEKARLIVLGEKKSWVDGEWETRDMVVGGKEQTEVQVEEDARAASFGS